MPNQRFRSVALTFVVVLLLGAGLAACGGGDDDESADATTTTEAPETTTTTAEVFDPGDEDTDELDSPEGDDQRAAIDDFMSGIQSETNAEAADESYTFTSISDDTGQLTVEAPAEWSEVDGAINSNFTPPIPDVRASTDLEAYNSTYSVPGFQFTATANSTTGDPGLVMDEFAIRTGQDCDRLDRQGYADPLYTGVSQVFTNCGGDPNASFVWTVVEPIDISDGEYIAVVGVQILDDADIEALGRILDTFVVTPA